MYVRPYLQVHWYTVIDLVDKKKFTMYIYIMRNIIVIIYYTFYKFKEYKNAYI